MITFKQLLESVRPEFIDLPNSDIVLLKRNNKSFTPYKRSSSGQLNPIRGKNKNGVLVWRTYKSIEDAKEDLGL